METIKQANKIIAEAIALLPDDAKGDYKTPYGNLFLNEAISNAMAMVNEDPEREALLEAYAIQSANGVVSALWRLELLPAELEAEYRKLPSMKEVAEKYNVFTKARKDRMDKLMEENKVLAEEEQELNIFKGVINGNTKKEAEKKLKEQTQAMRGAR